MTAINLTKLVEDADTHAIVKVAARKLLDEQYFRPGDWLKSVNDADLMTLALICSSMTDTTDDPLTQTILMLAWVLTQAEGNDIDTVQPGMTMLSLAGFINAELLARRKLVAIDYDRVSFDQDSLHTPVIQFSAELLKSMGDAPSVDHSDAPTNKQDDGPTD